jgi:hypothetical protein
MHHGQGRWAKLGELADCRARLRFQTGGMEQLFGPPWRVRRCRPTSQPVHRRYV